MESSDNSSFSRCCGGKLLPSAGIGTGSPVCLKQGKLQKAAQVQRLLETRGLGPCMRLYQDMGFADSLFFYQPDVKKVVCHDVSSSTPACKTVFLTLQGVASHHFALGVFTWRAASKPCPSAERRRTTSPWAHSPDTSPARPQPKTLHIAAVSTQSGSPVQTEQRR